MNLRPFQEEAVERIVESYLSGRRRAVLAMAAGTGKSMTARAAMERIATGRERLSVAWVDHYDAGRVSAAAWKGAAEHVKIAYFKYPELIADSASGAVASDAFDMLVFMEPAGALDDLEGLLTYFAGFSLVFTSVPEPHRFYLNNQNALVYQYTYGQALIESEQRGIALQSTLHGVNEQLSSGLPAAAVSEDLKLAEREIHEILEILKLVRQGAVSIDDILGMGEQKAQLQVFQQLLDDDDFFRGHIRGGAPPESVWQEFFQKNQWIFGFGLNYLFNSPLQGGKLEQVVAGHSIKSAGKRIDALLRSNGIISSLCFAEIKTHRKPLLKEVKTPYRPDAWAISDELAGGIAQLQRTVQISMENLRSSLAIKDADGYDRGEKLYMYKPRSFLVIGSLAEFTKEGGAIHEARYSSFQMFRNALSDVEVITFDELYERAKGLIGRPPDTPLRG